MGEVQFNHTEALNKAYAALHALRQEGYAIPPITALVKRSGVGRSTMYTNHPDWVRFLDVVKNNLPIKHLTEAGAASEERAEWVRRRESLEERIKKVKEEIQSVKNKVDVVFTRLTDELHKYVLRSKETPQQANLRADLLKKNANLNQELERIKSENAELRRTQSMPADIRALTKKEVVTIDDGLSGASPRDYDFHDRAVDVANSLDDFFAESHGARVPTVSYILCGNFASGKSKWVGDHVPLVPGVNLYLDGTNHTALIRKMFIKRIRKLAPTCMVFCVRLLAELDVCIKRNTSSHRERNKNVLPEELLTDIWNTFEEVSFDEGFDQIILVRNG